MLSEVSIYERRRGRSDQSESYVFCYVSQRTLGRAWRRGYSTRSASEDRALASSSGPSLVATQKGPGDEANLARIVV